MPEWAIHEKWCKRLGISEPVCKEVNRIIDLTPHDIVDNLLEMMWARDLFEAGELTNPFCILRGDKYEGLTKKLAEITIRFGRQGIKATFNHIALDYIAELINIGFTKEEIERRLIAQDLIKYVPNYEAIFADISRTVKPNPQKIKERKEFEETVQSGIFGVFEVNYLKALPGPAGLVSIRAKVKKGEAVYVKWGRDTYEARKGLISRLVRTEDDINQLITEIKTYFGA